MWNKVVIPEVSIDFGKIALGGVLIIFTLLILLLSETLNQEIRSAYQAKFGPTSWANVPLYSLLWGLGSGIISGIGGYVWADGYYFFYLCNFGAELGYISMQALITDSSLHKVDRYLLRIGYIDTAVLTFAYLTNTYRVASAFQIFAMPVFITYFAFFFLFLYSKIGPSDIRAMVVFLPFVIALDMVIAIESFIAVGVFIAIIMEVKKRREKNPQLAVPILPYLTIPYMIGAPLLPLIIELSRTVSL